MLEYLLFIGLFTKVGDAGGDGVKTHFVRDGLPLVLVCHPVVATQLLHDLVTKIYIFFNKPISYAKYPNYCSDTQYPKCMIIMTTIVKRKLASANGTQQFF